MRLTLTNSGWGVRGGWELANRISGWAESVIPFVYHQGVQQRTDPVMREDRI